MQARSSLNLPRPGDLKSTKLSAIQDYFDKLQGEIDTQYRKLFQDVLTLQVPETGFVYWGGKDTEGSWRIGRSGSNLVIQRLETAVWTTKDTITP